MRCWDSNPQPLEHESPPITTRPGLPPKIYFFFTFVRCFSSLSCSEEKNITPSATDSRVTLGSSFGDLKQSLWRQSNGRALIISETNLNTFEESKMQTESVEQA